MLTWLVTLFRRPHGTHVALLLGAVVAVVLAGGVAFALSQHLSVTTGLYWAVTTATTVGYGDVTPKNGTGRLIATLVMLTSIPMLAAAFAIVTGSITISRIREIFRMGGARMPADGFRLVIGTHPSIAALVEELVAAHEHVVLVAEDEPAGLPSAVHVVKGDPTDTRVLSSVSPERAGQALVVGHADATVLVCAVLLRQLAPELPIAALARSQPVVAALKDLGVNQVVSVERLVSHVLAKSLEAPHAGDLLLALLDSEQHELVERPATPSEVGRRLSAVRGEPSNLVLGVVSGGKVVLGIGDDPILGAGDSLLLGAIRAKR